VGKVGIHKSFIEVDSRLHGNDNIEIFWTYETACKLGTIKIVHQKVTKNDKH